MYAMLCLSYTDGQTNCSIQRMFQSSKLCEGIAQWLNSAEIVGNEYVCWTESYIFFEANDCFLPSQRISTKLFMKTQVVFGIAYHFELFRTRK